MPAAYVDHSGAAPATYYVHTDQVMRPRKLTDAAAAVLWDRIATPFGDEHTVTGTLTQKLQFPGQIEETETDFYQNWRRDYDPELGRYVQSDPIGLLGGISTYGYVGGNPVSLVDPTGEFAQAPLLIRASWALGTLAGRVAAPHIARALIRAGVVTAVAASIPSSTPISETADNGCGDDDDVCERRYKDDTDTCSAITRRRGKRAGAVCHASAAERYGECLAGGPGNIRTPLNTWNN